MGAWRLMIRLARRDLRRHRGRALLTAALVALPTLVLATLATAVATLTVDNSESLSADLGSTPAAVTVVMTGSPGSNQVGVKQLTADPQSLGDMGVAGNLLHGKQATSAEAISEVTGGTARPLSVKSTRVVLGERRIRANVLGVDGRLPAYSGTATLTSGRWPRTPNEVLVTDAGRSIGIPSHGTFALHSDGSTDRTMTVVGGARTLQAQDLVTLPDASAGSISYLIDRADPVTWTDVQRWNSYGLAVRSRLLIEHPELVPPQQGWSTQNGASTAVLTVLLTGGVLLTVLVAGPAFTTSADRHRRALGQLASNGATRAMLRRYVLAQALLLGVLTAIGAVLVGAGLGAGIVALARRIAPRHAYGPTDFPWTQLGGLALIAVISALVAALLPAIQAGRVSVIAVLRGHASVHKVRAGWPILGLILAAVGGVVLWRTITSNNLSGGEVKIAGSGVLLFGGAVLALPWLLAQVAKLASVLPVASRIATRDIGRQRSRATSGVAAVMAASALMTALAIGGTSDIAQAKRDYEPSAPIGDAVVTGDTKDLARFAATARTVDPSLQIAPIATVGQYFDPSSTAPTGQLVLAATGKDCPVPTTAGDAATSIDCAPLGAGGMGGVGALDASQAQRMLGLTDAERDWLASGKALALQAPSASGMSSDGGVVNTVPGAIARSGQVRFSWTTATRGAAAKPLSHQEVLPVKVIDGTTPLRSIYLRGGSTMIITPAVAAAHHWPTDVQRLLLRAPGGISSELEQQLSDRAADSVTVSVERGYQDKSMLIIEIMLAAFALIVLAVTLIGTALAQSESRSDQATLAAIGAPRSIRRRIGAGYALAIGLVGGVAGFLVGLVPGIAVTWPLTIESWNPNVTGHPLINIPWILLLPALLGTPVVAALVAVLTTRSSPALTRRQAT
ncbi:FtsX-like permease family protein [Calidifontibacter terrae]